MDDLEDFDFDLTLAEHERMLSDGSIGTVDLATHEKLLEFELRTLEIARGSIAMSDMGFFDIVCQSEWARTVLANSQFQV